MRILYFLHNSDYSGANMSFFDYIVLQKKYSFLVVFPKDSNDSLENKFIEASIPYIRVRMRMGYYADNNIRASIKKALYRFLLHSDYKNLKKHINFSEYDLIHSNSIGTQLGAYCAIKEKKIHVWHLREFMEEDYGYHFYSPKMLKNKMLPYSNLVLITNAIKEKWGVYSKKQSIVLYNGIKDESKEHKSNNDCTKCLIAGNLSSGKGQDEAIRAVEIVKRNGFSISLDIYGDGEEHDNLQSLIKELHAEDYVFLKGFSYDLFEVRKDIDISLICSKKEALGRVTVESMYAENIVIGANTGGTKELVTDGENGFLYQQGSAEDLANKIMYVIKNKDQMNSIRQNALQFAKSNFDPKAYIYKLYSFYEEITK